MVANAYVFVRVEPQRTEEVRHRLRAIPRAVVREVLGPYDLVVELAEDTTVDITSIVRFKIRSIQGVTETVTCLWMGSSDVQAGGE